MKVGTAVRKVKEVRSLINEYHQIKATMKYIEKDVNENCPLLPKMKDSENLKRKLISIEETFDKIFK